MKSEKRRYGSVNIIKRIKVYSIKDGLDILKGNVSCGHSIDLKKDRYSCFLKRGYTCYMCKLKGSYFALEDVASDSYSGYTINLYGEKECGREEYFTKDHVIPKVCGGKNHISNYDTMCWTCNRKKGASLL